MMVFGASAASAQAPALFTAVSGDLSTAAAEKAQALRDRRGTAALDLVAADVNALGEQTSISLPDGVTYTVDRVSTDVRGVSDYTWSGDIPGKDGNVTLVVRDGEITGGISDGTNRYSITPIGGGIHAVAKIDQSAFPNEERPLPGGGTVPDGSGAGDAAAGATAFVDVLVAYTTNSRLSYGANMEALIQQFVGETNNAYGNSGIDARLELVGTIEIDINEDVGTPGNLLEALQDANESEFQRVHNARNQLAADLVVLITARTDGFCGIGFVVSVPTSAFSVVNYDCGIAVFTFGHEVGHNMGADHDPPNAFNPNLYAPYAHGFASPLNGFRTMMAYDTSCPVGLPCPRQPVFSNPNVFFNGITPMGTAATHNNTRVHNERAGAVAAFLVVAAPPVGGRTGAFEPLSLLGLAGLALVGLRRRKAASAA